MAKADYRNNMEPNNCNKCISPISSSN